jgi:hypothetical protein
MSDPKHPKPNDQVLDLSDIALSDIMPGHVNRLLKLRDGHELAIDNVLSAGPIVIKRAGLHPDEIQAIAEPWAAVQRIDEVVPAVEKLLELLKETRLVHGHTISVRLGELANQIRRRADHAPSDVDVLAPFEPLLSYQSGPAMKAAATKEKARAKETAPSDTPT